MNGVLAVVYRHSTAAALRVNGRPRTNTRVTGRSWSTQSGPMVSVSQPGAVHCVTIGMAPPYPLRHSSNTAV